MGHLKAPHSPPYRYAALAGLCVFGLYSITLAPTTAFWDTSEYIATAHIMGIAHPPGNPLFVLLAHSWDILLSPFGIPVAVRINLFSAFMSALAHACWFLVVERILYFFVERRPLRLAGSAAAILVSATAFTVWNQSNVNEKVYTVSLFTIALLSWLIYRWRDRAGQPRNDNVLALIAFLLALSVGNHLMTMLAAPAILAFVLVVNPRIVLRWQIYPVCIAAAALGLSVHLFLPIRARLNPIVNQANPVCATTSSAFVSILTLGRAGCPALSESLARRQYGKPSMFSDPVVAGQRDMPRSPALLGAQVMNYLQYFDWQWARSFSGNRGWFGGARPLVTLLFLSLGIYGALHHYRSDRASFVFVAVLMTTLSFGLVFYLNFKYGYTSPWADAAHLLTEVRERDYFFIVSVSIWGLWTGVGLTALSRRVKSPSVLALAAIPLFANWSWAARSNDYAARDWSYNLLMSVEPYGVLITNGDNDTFPLWYLQEVEGVRQDVAVIVTSYLNTGWYAKQLRDLTRPCSPGTDASADNTRIICQRAYVPPDPQTMLYGPAQHAVDAAPTTSRSGESGLRVPRHSILDLPDAEIDRISTNAFISPAATFSAGAITSDVREGTEILPADIFLAQIIKSSIEDRPIYFALTSNGYQSLQLQDHLLQQGVAYKLVNDVLKQDAALGIVDVSPVTGTNGPHFVDVPRTDVLVSKVFVHHAGFPDRWNHWTDAASEQVPLFYAAAYRALVYSYAVMGDTARAQQIVGDARRFERLANVRALANQAK
jgi:hypothetical protein